MTFASSGIDPRFYRSEYKSDDFANQRLDRYIQEYLQTFLTTVDQKYCKMIRYYSVFRISFAHLHDTVNAYVNDPPNRRIYMNTLYYEGFSVYEGCLRILNNHEEYVKLKKLNTEVLDESIVEKCKAFRIKRNIITHTKSIGPKQRIDKVITDMTIFDIRDEFDAIEEILSIVYYTRYLSEPLVRRIAEPAQGIDVQDIYKPLSNEYLTKIKGYYQTLDFFLHILDGCSPALTLAICNLQRSLKTFHAGNQRPLRNNLCIEAFIVLEACVRYIGEGDCKRVSDRSVNDLMREIFPKRPKESKPLRSGLDDITFRQVKEFRYKRNDITHAMNVEVTITPIELIRFFDKMHIFLNFASKHKIAKMRDEI